jgi:hypothetical protein
MQIQKSQRETTPLETDQRRSPLEAQRRAMANITIFCPRTGSNVQVWVTETRPGDHDDAYEAVTCPGCGRLHFVNKTTGKTLSGRTKPKSSVRQ